MPRNASNVVAHQKINVMEGVFFLMIFAVDAKDSI
jgi:hypothetical protein